METGSVSQVLGEHFDGDRTVEFSIAGEVDRGHPAAPEDILDAITPAGEGLDAQSFAPVVVVVEIVVPSVVVASLCF